MDWTFAGRWISRDFQTNGLNLSKQVMIFTEHEQLVADYIIKDIDRGCTVFYGKGGYTGKDNCVILTILTRN